MYVCMYVCICVCMYVSICICTCMFMYVCTCMRTHAYIFLCLCICGGINTSEHCSIYVSFIFSFIHSFKDLYSTSSRKLLRGAPDSSTVKKNSFQLIIECV